MKTFSHSLQYHADFFLEREIFQTQFVEKIKTHTSFSVPFFSENRAVHEVMRKMWYSLRGHK